MLDLEDFIAERGGNPEKVRESQRRRGDPVEVVDEVVTLWDDHRRGMFSHKLLLHLRSYHVTSAIHLHSNRNRDQ
jgi:seryl-tRNA synthetase